MSSLLPQDNTAGNLAGILNSIPGLTTAINGKTTTTSNSGISSAGLSALLNQILSGTQGLASVAGGQNSAGLYNSSVQQQSVNDLLTRTAGEVEAKGPTSSTSFQAPTLNLGTTLLEGAAGLAGNKILSPILKPVGTALDNVGTGITNALGITTSAPTTFGASTFTLPGADALAGSAGSDAAGLGAGATGAFTAPASAGLTGTAAAGAGIDAGVSAGLSAGLTGAGALGAATAGGLGLAGAATGAGIDAGAVLGGLGAGVDAGVASAGAAALGGAGAAAGGAAAGGGIADAITGAVALWVICTEFHAIGEMDTNTYTKAAPDFVARCKLKPSAVRGYHFWAVPYTKLMRRQDWIGSLARTLMRPLAKGRADYINGKWNVLGWYTFKIGEPICSLIGKTIARKPQNWQSLYTNKSKGDGNV